MILTVALIYSVHVHSLERLAKRVCNARLTVVEKMYGDIVGYNDGVDMWLTNQPVDEARITVLHECAHILHPDFTEQQCENFAYSH